MATVTSSKRHLLVTSDTYTSNGDVTVGGDLYVNGSQTTINTATLDVEDRNITLNYGGTASTSQGAGITITGSNATLLWDHANTKWTLSNGLSVSGNISASNLSGTNTGDQDLSGYALTSHNHDGRYIRLDTATTPTNRVSFGYGVSDLNSVGGGHGVTGFRSTFQASNRPGSGNYATGVEFTYHDTGARTQFVAASSGQNTTPELWVRGEAWGSTPSWGDWYQIYHENHKPTPVEIGAQPAGNYETDDGSDDRYVFKVDLPNLANVTRWYKVATVNQGNGGLLMRGSLTNHVESFGSTKFDLTIQGRDANASDQIEITGSIDVFDDNTGVYIVKSAVSGSYTTYDVYIECYNYTQAWVELIKTGLTSFDTSGNYVTTSPSGLVELDTSAYGEGSYTIIDSENRFSIRKISANTTQISGNAPSSAVLRIGASNNNQIYMDGSTVYINDDMETERIYINTCDTNTTSTTALVLNNTEVEKRTLGSAAFTAVGDYASNSHTHIWSEIDNTKYASGASNMISSASTGSPSSSSNIVFDDSGGVNKIALSSLDLSLMDNSSSGFLTSSSTQSKYLRSDANDIATGDIEFRGNVTFGGTSSNPKEVTIGQIASANSENTSLMLDGNGVVKTRNLGTAAFSNADSFLRSDANDTGTGIITLSQNNSTTPYPLIVKNASNGNGVGIEFDDNSGGTQRGYIEHFHSDTKSYGSGATMIIRSSEGTTTILADGKLMYNEGIYSKPASGTGAGTRKDSNWDSAYTHSTSAHAPANAEQNVQSDWNATSGDAFIQNKPTIPSGSSLVKLYNNVDYIASGGTSGTYRDNYGAGLAVYEGYNTGANRPHTYDTTLQVMSTSSQGFEISADWVSNTSTPLKVRSLRDCCQGWNPWTTIWTQHNFTQTNVNNWNTAYNNHITGIAVTGTSTKTITLTQQDGGTISANFTDQSGSGGITMSGGVNDRILTATSASAIQGEANLQYNGSYLKMLNGVDLLGYNSAGGNFQLRSENPRRYAMSSYETGITALTTENRSDYAVGNGRAVTALVLGNTPFGTGTASSNYDIFNITRVNQAAYGPSSGQGSFNKILNLRGNGDLYLGHTGSTGAMYATKYYDKASTGYYLDPGSTGTSLNVAGSGTFAGGLTISGSLDSGGTDMGYYQSVGTNVILKGDSNGRSGIFFESEKNGANINDPSDYGFIQFHSYGYGNTSGEANNLVIGVANDSTDKVILQAPYNGGVMVGYKDATSGTGLTLSEVIHSNASSYNNGNWDTAYGWGNHASAGYAAGNHNHDGTYVKIGATHSLGSVTRFQSNNVIDTTSGNQSPLEVFQDNAGHDAFMAFHISGDYAAYFGLDGASNDFVVGGWSKGAVKQRVFHDGYHPNADQWTTGRTITIGSTGKTVTGGGNVSWTLAEIGALGATAKAADSELIDGIDSSRIVYGDGGNKITDVSNFNSRNNPSGFFQGYNASNSPTTGTWYNMVNVRHSNTANSHGFQIAASYYDENIWTRTYQGGSSSTDGNYTTWRRLYHEGHLPTLAELGAQAAGSYAAASHTHSAADITSGTFGNRFSTSTRYSIGLTDGNTSQTRDKLRVWGGGTYTIGMKSGFSYGHLNDYAMSFQMNSDNDRGWWWGDSSHTDAQGAMSLTTNGRLVVATSLSIGQGESVTSPSTEALYVNGSADVSTNVTARGHFYGRSVNGQYSNIYRMGGIYFTWDSDSYGTNTHHSIRSTYGDSYGDDITINSYHHLRINIDSNNNNTDEKFEIGQNTTGTGNVRFRVLGTGAVYAANDVIAFYSFSDKRLKTDIKPTTDNLDKVLKLEPVEYSWKDGSRDGKKEIGLIAQDVEKVVPEVVRENTRLSDDDDTLYKQVDYEHLVSTLIGAVQEQQDQIELLKAEIKELKNK